MKGSIISMILLLFLFSCTHDQQETDSFHSIHPHSFKAAGLLVPTDSIIIPNPVSVGIPQVKLAGKPEVVPTNKNRFNSEVSLKSVNTKIKPGNSAGDTLFIGKKVPAIDSHFIGNTPEITIAKDPYIKNQNPDNFSTYSKLQGLKNSVIRCIIEDKNRNLWFATDGGGVTKYDGKFFTHYTTREGLSDDAVLCILQDRHGALWFGTNEGVCRYDGRFFTQFNFMDDLNNHAVYCVAEDTAGNLWFGTDGGFTKYDGRYFTNYSEKNRNENSKVQSILIDKTSTIWFGTFGGGVFSYDGQSFNRFAKNELLISKFINCIMQDRDGFIWFGSDGEGLSRYCIDRGMRIANSNNTDIQNQHFVKNGLVQNSYLNITEKEGLSSNVVKCILQDKLGNIWAGTDGGGLSKIILNDINGSIKLEVTHFMEKEGLYNNVVRSNLQDSNGNLWFGTNDGVSKYNGKIFSHYTINEGLKNNAVRCLLKDKSGNIWVGTDGGGVSKYDGKSFTHYTTKQGLSNNCVLSILQDKKGNFWFGTDAGANKFDGKSFTIYSEREGLSNNAVYSILEDRDGNIWFGTDGGFVTKFDGKDFRIYSAKEGLSKSSVYCMLEDTHNNIWFGTRGGGIIRYARKQKGGTESFTHFTQKEGLSSNAILSILQDRQGNIWFGTDGAGLLKYKGDTFTNYTENDGLCDKTIRSILEDCNGNIWVGTRFGLSKILHKDVVGSDPELFDSKATRIELNNKKLPILFKNLTYDDGFLGIECNRGAICEDNSGTIWVGTVDRLTAFHPEGTETDNLKPEIAIIGVDLFNEKIEWGKLKQKKDSTLVLRNGVSVCNYKFDRTSSWYDLPYHLSLAHTNNYLTFKFIGITQQQSSRVKYQYKLDGLEDNWGAPTLRNEASYANLSFGEYVFRIRAFNSEGYCSNEFTYPFTIRPPWWKTIWFNILAFVIFGSFAYGFFQWRIKTLQSQKRELENTVTERTKEVLSQKEELEASLNNLQITQKQLVKSEKMASLGILAAGVAHEINNPLNFIQGGIEGLEVYFNEHLQDHLPQVNPLINGIRVGVSRAAEIVTSLNRYSRLDNQKKYRCDIHMIIDNCLLMLQNLTKNKITIIKKFERQPFSFIGNESRLQQALLNILTNGIQAIETTGLITITTEYTKGSVCITIEDSGHGIQKENLPRIFDPFFTTKEPGKGTGLGLSITYSIIEEHNGSIEIKSEKNKGTVVSICLPIKSEITI
jgi:signal transduction histidine kinase/ligand-binding sensor domain-containing protein